MIFPIFAIMMTYMLSVQSVCDNPSQHLRNIPTEHKEITFSRTLTEGFTCTFAVEDCNNNGVCNKAGTECICDDDYTTYDATVESGECNYKRKSGLIALILSIFVGEFGAVYFYVGDTTTGCIQLFLAGALAIFVGAVFGGCLGGAVSGCDENAVTGCSSLWAGLGGLAMIIMYIVVLALVIGGNINDSNGIALSPIG